MVQSSFFFSLGMNIYVFHKLIYAFQFVLVVNLIYQIDNQFPIVFYPFLFLHFACPFLSRKYVRFFSLYNPNIFSSTYFLNCIIFCTAKTVLSTNVDTFFICILIRINLLSLHANVPPTSPLCPSWVFFYLWRYCAV